MASSTNSYMHLNQLLQGMIDEDSFEDRMEYSVEDLMQMYSLPRDQAEHLHQLVQQYAQVHGRAN